MYILYIWFKSRKESVKRDRVAPFISTDNSEFITELHEHSAVFQRREGKVCVRLTCSNGAGLQGEGEQAARAEVKG